MIVNLAWYESLPPDLRRIFDEVAVETIALSDRLNRDKEKEYIALLSEGLETNRVSPEDLEPFREAVGPVYQHFVEKGDFSMEDIERARRAARGDGE